MGKTYATYLSRYFQQAEQTGWKITDTALYTTLLAEASSQGWPEEMEIPTHRLLARLGGMSKQTFVVARERLARIGMLDYEEGARRSATPRYRLLTGREGDIQKSNQNDPENQTKNGEEEDKTQKSNQKSPKIKPKTEKTEQDNTLIKNIDNNNLSSSSSLPHAREAEFFAEMARDEIYQEQLAITLGFMAAGMSITEIPELLNRFKTQCEMDACEHQNLNHARRHFRDWLRKEVKWRIKNQDNPKRSNDNAIKNDQRTAAGASPAGGTCKGSGRHGLNE